MSNQQTGNAVPYQPPVVPQGPQRTGTLLFNGISWARAVECNCYANFAHQGVHLPGCDWLDLSRMALSASPEKPAKPVLLLPWAVPPVNPKATKKWNKRRTPEAKPYRFVLQFYFTRPIEYALWKMIKAPLGWRKSPLKKDAQNKWCGVRFLCNELKYALTPDEVEQLRSTLLMCLMEVY